MIIRLLQVDIYIYIYETSHEHEISLQYGAFVTSGSKLTQRIRGKAFASLLRQEVAFFDRPENSSGAICARLSSDALAIQQMSGHRLGLIVEIVAVFIVGASFGLVLSWQLSVISILCTIIVLLIGLVQISSQTQYQKRVRPILARASAVRLSLIHFLSVLFQSSS